MDLSFTPNTERAIALDERMRHELARSLEQLKSQIESQLSSSETALLIPKLVTVITALNLQKQISPAVFATYYQLIFSISNEDNNYPAMLNQLVSTLQHQEQLVFHDLSMKSLGSQELVTLYNRCLNTDEYTSFEFLPPDTEESQRTKKSVLRALALMEKVAPEMAGEFTSIVNEVIFAAASKQPNANRFDGASSYMLWGALVLSVDDEKSDLEMMETLAHESGHSFLFGQTIKEPLTLNDESELYHSPLRQDPRPMDGIYHATFVSARMHYAMNEARSSGILDKGQLQECHLYLAASKKAFDGGYDIVVEHGELSPTGQTIIDSAHSYMSEYAYS